MSRIRVLSEKVATQIAAGEVVERPASVLRELLDNSIDASADRIEVQVEAGGLKLVRVTDNGIGMDRDDLLLSLERHATSKVRVLEDLFAVGTLGFRGEAVPSIAAVSRMEVKSRTRDGISGHRLRMEGGRVDSIEEVGTPVGTVTTVRDLFFNTPARRKFLRSPRTETRHLLDIFSRIALPFKKISFRLREGGRTLAHYPASESEEERLAMLMGREIAGRMERVELAAGPVTILAHLAPPDFSRTRGDRILFYVNGRSVRDRMLTRAVMEGYGRRLMRGQYPQAVISLELDPALVDVNVHPTKQEVRFRDGKSVFLAVASAVGGVMFANGGLTVHSESEAPAARKPFPAQALLKAADPPHYYQDPYDSEEAVRVEGDATLSRLGLQESSFFVIGQLRNTYILCQTGGGLLLVDQHAAHERVVYERLKRGITEGPLQVQTFLIPKSMEVSVSDAAALEQHKEAMALIGFEVEHFGGATFLLRSVPAILLNADLEALLHETLDHFNEKGAETARETIPEKVLCTMACHGAVRGGKPLTMREMTSLLDELQKTELPTNCPHGRPVSRMISWPELERMFKRTL